MKYQISTTEKMEELGAMLANVTVNQSFILFLKGNLGAGKTTFVRGFLRALGYQGKIKSPTFTLVEPYYLHGRDIFHFDLYRLNSQDELEAIGWRDYFASKNIVLIEWPEKAGNFLPVPDLIFEILILNNTHQVMWSAKSLKGKKVLKSLC